MLSLLRHLARTITGKVDPLEFALGMFFGILLGLIPFGEVDPGTGILGKNLLWMIVLFGMLLLRASLPVGICFFGLSKALGIVFLDSVAFGFGQSMLDGAVPQGLVEGFATTVPSWQLHTYWGFGASVLGGLLGLAIAAPLYLLMRTKLPIWRERVGQTKFAKAAAGFLPFRVIGYLIR